MTNKQATEAPEQIWAVTDLGLVGTGRWVTQGTENPFGNIEYVRADIAEAARQAGIDEALHAIATMPSPASETEMDTIAEVFEAVQALKSEGCK